MSEYKVGDVVWVVWSQRGAPHEAAVTSVGRKWATLDKRGRFDMTTGAIDGGNYTSPGTVYRNRGEWEARMALATAWAAFRQAVDRKRGPPTGVTVEAIEQARALLGLGVVP